MCAKRVYFGRRVIIRPFTMGEGPHSKLAERVYMAEQNALYQMMNTMGYQHPTPFAVRLFIFTLGVLAVAAFAALFM